MPRRNNKPEIKQRKMGELMLSYIFIMYCVRNQNLYEIFFLWNNKHMHIHGKRAKWNSKSIFMPWTNMAEAMEAKTANTDDMGGAKQAVWMVKSWAQKEEFATVSQDGGDVSISQNRWTLLMRSVYTAMLVSLPSAMKTRWRHAFGTILGCPISSLSGEAMCSLDV